MNALNSYLMLPFIALNGGHMSLIVARMPQLIVAILTMPAVYFAVRKASSDEVLSTWSLFAVAICPWHIQMSRYGLESNLVVGFLVFGFLCFLYGLENPRILLLSAFFYGLSLYCYAVVWPVMPFVLLLQTVYVLITRRIKITKYFWMALQFWGYWLSHYFRSY